MPEIKLTDTEVRLLNLIRSSKDPAQAFEITVDHIAEAIKRQQRLAELERLLQNADEETCIELIQRICTRLKELG